jgi:hypothetical protein
MKDDGETGDAFFDFSEDIETDFGIGTGFEFESTV